MRFSVSCVVDGHNVGDSASDWLEVKLAISLLEEAGANSFKVYDTAQKVMIDWDRWSTYRFQKKRGGSRYLIAAASRKDAIVLFSNRTGLQVDQFNITQYRQGIDSKAATGYDDEIRPV